MHRRKMVTDEITPIYQYKTSMHSVKPSEDRKEQKERQSHLHQSDVMDDAIKVGAGSVNRRIARKHHTVPKHSCSHIKEDDNFSMNISKQFFVKLAFILMLIGNVIKSALSLNSLNLKRVIGLATLACVSRETRRSADLLLPTPPCVFGGKCSCAYILSHTNVYASWMHYFDKFIKNLDFEYETRGFFQLVYLYMCVFDSSWTTCKQATLSSKIATLACNILYTLVYLLSEWSFPVRIIHDKYHRQFLIGLMLAYKAGFQIQYFLLCFCTNWKELRPLVTPRAYGIKEGFNPCIIQKQFMPSYALVSHSPLSLLSLTILLCYFYYCYFYYCCYEYFTVKGLYKTVTTLSLSLFFFFSLLFSLPMLLLAMCGVGNLAHTVAVVSFCLSLSFPLLLLAVCGVGNLAHTVAVVLLCLLLSFPLLLLAMCGVGNLAHTVAVVCFCLSLSFPLLLLAMCVVGNLAHTVAVVRFCLSLSFPLLLLAFCGVGNLAHTVAVVLFCLSLSFPLLLLAMCGVGNLAHTVAVVLFCLSLSFPLLLLAMCGVGNLAHTVAVVCFCLSLSFPLLLLAMCGVGNLAHTVAVVCFCLLLSFPLLLLAMCGVGNLAHTVAVVCFCLLLSFLLLLLAGYDVGARNELLLAIETFYLFSYRTVGLRIDGNLCPYLLSPTAPAPRIRCLGQSVARFASLFWSLFGAFLESIWSRELYNQLATQPGPLGCIPPTATLQATPHPLKRATEACFAPRKGPNSRGSFSSPHLDAFLTCLKAKIDKLYAIFLFAFNFPGTFERLGLLLLPFVLIFPYKC